MAKVSKSFAVTINKWKILIGGFKKHKDTLPFAEDEAKKLNRLITETEALNLKQEQMKTDLSKLTEQIKNNVEEGNKFYASILRFAKGKFGPTSKDIKDFIGTGEGVIRKKSG